jgi:hypothetical protein
MHVSTGTHPSPVSRSPRHRVGPVARRALAVVSAIALALVVVSTWAEGHIVGTRHAVSYGGSNSQVVRATVPQLPAGYRAMPPSKLVALGIVRDPRTGQWMCIRVGRRNAAPSSHYTRVAFRP